MSIATAVAIAAPPTGVTYGDTAPLVANVSVKDAAPTQAVTVGMVDFKDTTTNQDYQVAVDAEGMAALSLAPLTAATHAFTVQYVGATDTAGNEYAASDAASASVEIAKAPLVATPADATRAVGEANPVLTGTIDGLKHNDNITATYSTTATTDSPAGTYDITAALADPDAKLDNYNVTLNTGVLTVTAPTPTTPATTTTLTSSTATSVYGRPIELTATVTSDTAGEIEGKVRFLDGDKLIAERPVTDDGEAHLKVWNLSTGTHDLTAQFVCNEQFAESSSSAVTEEVAKAATSQVIVSSAKSAVQGKPVTFTAIIRPDYGSTSTPNGTQSHDGQGQPRPWSPASAQQLGGTVTFMDGDTALSGPIEVSHGMARFTTSNLAAGDHAITAVYSGDANYEGGTSAALTEAVRQSLSTVHITASPKPAIAGQPVTFSIDVTPRGNKATTAPTGNVELYDLSAGGRLSLGTATLDDGKATLTAALTTPGPHLIVANYAGDNVFAASRDVAIERVTSTNSKKGSGSSSVGGLKDIGLDLLAGLVHGGSSHGATDQALQDLLANWQNPKLG